jgi:DNA-binding HxlR family transcriptional regulator
MNSPPATDNAASAGEAVWQRVTPILGKQYMSHASPELIAHFKRLVIGANIGGRDASGPVREVLALLGDRWSTLLLQLAHFGPLRYSTLQRIIAVLQDSGITRRMLSLKLRALERDGLVLRTVTASAPPRVEYQLTKMGEDLWVIAAHLVDWLQEHSTSIDSARAAFEQQEAADAPEGDEE